MANIIETTYTIEEFIAAGQNTTIDYDGFSFTDLMSNNTLISVLNVVNDYMDELKNLSVRVRLDDEQYRKYLFKPKLLCRDLYGNAEIYYIIMLLNNIIDVKEFDLKTFLALKKADMTSVISLIYNAEREAIQQYNIND